MPALDYAKARAELEHLFSVAEAQFRTSPEPRGPADALDATATLFSSSVQSYREALLGCCIARIIDDSIDIRLPYMNQGEAAYNGRTLDERVINPFLHVHEIPASKGPFLAAFRRNVSFTASTARGLRDTTAYNAMLACIEMLRAAGTTDEQRARDPAGASIPRPARCLPCHIGARRQAKP